MAVGGSDGIESLDGRIDSARIMTRALEPDELLHAPETAVALGAFESAFTCLVDP